MLEQYAVELLLKTVKNEARREGRYFLIEYGRPVKFSIAASSFLPVLLIYALISSAEKEMWLYIVTAGFALLFAYLLIEVFMYRIKADEFEILVESPWSGKRRVPWNAVTRVTYSQTSQYYTLETVGHEKIRVSTILSGKGTLFALMQEHAPHMNQ